MIIIASLSADRKSCNGLPRACIFPIVVPRTTLNMTIPSTFVEADKSELMAHVSNGGSGAVR